MGSGNYLVDQYEADRAFHYPVERACEYCDDRHFVSSVPEWISAARESRWIEHEGNGFRRAMAECKAILIDGEAECPACR